jgi:murein DD-endopeptidase MepM/ murein hydrolase activator NlpD
MHKALAFWRQLALLCGVCLVSMFLLALWSGSQSSPSGGLRAAALYPDSLERKQVVLGTLFPLEHTFRAGEMLYDVLLGKGLVPQQVSELITAGREAFDVRRASPGDRLRLYRDASGQVDLFEMRRAGSGATLVVQRTPLGLIASRREPRYSVQLALAEGTISSSLYADAVREGLDHRLVMELADVFAWDIDFLSDLQPGDTFRVIYEQKMAEAGPAKAGRILAAEMVNEGRVHTAYYFKDDEGHAGYYDAAGRSLQKEFLKSPLRYKHITSGFSHARLHPILKIRRPHLGVDYAAPTGTPVEAVADGRIAYRGWKSGFGNYVEIKHRRSMTTCYGHLAGFAKGLCQGELVRQGQVIGYVGATGMATGPHLDFRIAEHGTWVDPVKKRGRETPPIPPTMRARFASFVSQVRSRFPSFEGSAVQ